MPERFKGPVLKTGVPIDRDREFESHSHRSNIIDIC